MNLTWERLQEFNSILENMINVSEIYNYFQTLQDGTKRYGIEVNYKGAFLTINNVKDWKRFLTLSRV